MRNQQNIPKWVKRIRLQPEVTTSFIQSFRLNPLKDYEVISEDFIHYWVLNESGERTFILKTLAYEVKRPLVSTTKALVQLSKRKFVAGTMVRVADRGLQYTCYQNMADRMKLTHFNYGHHIANGEEGMVLGCEKHHTTKIDIYAVLIGDREVLYSESGLEAIHNV